MEKDIEKLMAEAKEIIEEIIEIGRKRDSLKESSTPYICAVLGLVVGLGAKLFGDISYHLYGAACYATSHLIDIASTIYVSKESEKFKKKHGYYLARETNPDMPEHPAAKDIIFWGFKRPKFLADLAISAIFPPGGFYLSADKFLAFWNNKMVVKGIKLEDKLREKAKNLAQNLGEHLEKR